MNVKRVFLILLILPLFTMLQGCLGDAVRAAGAYNNVRSGYQAYQGIKGVKDMEQAVPVLKDSDTLYVMADLKSSGNPETLNRSAAERICAAFEREFDDMKARDLNRGRELRCLSSGDVPDDAVVLNLREQVEANRALRLIQSDTIKSETSWVSRATGAVLDTQTNPGLKRHDELIEFVGRSLSMQLLRSLAPAQDDPEYGPWAQRVGAWSKERKG